MLTVAQRRPRQVPDLPVDFRQLDAQTGDLGQGVFDAAFSRFGVMFFNDSVRAFKAIKRESRRPPLILRLVSIQLRRNALVWLSHAWLSPQHLSRD
jgi:hypothetical protein